MKENLLLKMLEKDTKNTQTIMQKDDKFIQNALIV